MVRVLSTLLVAAAFLVGSNAYDSGTGGRSTSQRAGGGSVRQRNRVNVIVTMKERTSPVLDSINSQKFGSRGQRIHALRQGLEGHARTSQARVAEVLDSAGASFSHSESYWVTNQMYVAGASPDLIEKLSKLPNVASVTPEEIFPMVAPVLENAATFTTTAVTAQWGVNNINAPSVWATGYTGTGVTVGIIDTGVLATHEAISGNWRSSFGWYDPEKKMPTPYDATGHGTHVTGIIAGNNGIGVAPGVSWIMCKGCRATGCYTSDLLACFQFMLCPTSADGATKDCSKTPHIVNNSWGGGSGLTTFDSVINSWRTAGIIPVVAAGNTGPSCGTTQTPGDNVNVITVGSTDASNNLASYSAKGPTKTGAIKPDLMAPGSSITSSCYTADNAYCQKSGTSMSTPAVTGAIALYLSARPGSTYSMVKNAFQSTATRVTTATGYTCGSTLDAATPNNQFGYGRIDVYNALSQ